MISSSRETLAFTVTEQSEDPLRASALPMIYLVLKKDFATLCNQNTDPEKKWCPTLGPRCFIHETNSYGKTIIAGEFITKGTKLYNCIGEIYDHPTTYTVQIDENKHINCTQGTCEFTCHNCNANSAFQLEEDGKLVLVAIHDIEAGEQITFNYCCTEWSMATPFKCLCGCDNCLGYISGFSGLPEERRDEIFRIALPHIQERALREGLVSKNEKTQTY